jgi:ABC-2 type transport system permease protein
MIWRNFILFGHNLTVVFVFFLIQSPLDAYRALVMFPYGLVVAATLFFPSLLVARLGTRFRDLRVLIPSVLQLIFFVTPILWTVPETGMGKVASDLNPIAWLIETAYVVGITGSFNNGYSIQVLLLLIVMIGTYELLRRRLRSIRNIL